MVLKFSKRQWLILLVYSIVNILSGFCGSLQGPFYPMVAESKGATPSQYGFVFGAFNLSVLFVSLVCGTMISKFGVVKVNLSGLLIIGITSIMFGFVDKLCGTVLFISISAILRIFEGFGFAMVRNAGFTIVSCEFSENIETSFSIVNNFLTVGYLIGPVAGGALYEVGGFYLPFVLIGALLISTSFVVIFLPRDYPKQEQNFNKEIVKFLGQPFIILGIFNTFGSFFNFQFVISILEPHMQSLNLSPVQVGSTFLCLTVSYSVGSFFWGFLCEKYNNPLFVCCISALVSICGLLLLGPAPYLFIDFNLYTCIFGLFIQGIGIGGAILGGFSLLNKGTSIEGQPKSIQTSAFVSTIYTSTLSLGSLLGPVIGGYLFETLGFPWGSHLFISYNLILCIILIIYQFRFFGSVRQELRNSNELKPLAENIVKYNSIE